MKKFLKICLVVVVLGVSLLVASTVLQMQAMNRQASRLVKQSASMAVGSTRVEVLAAMPNDLLVSTNPPTADEIGTTRAAVAALRYNAPVLLNSVYVLMLFDSEDKLIEVRRFD